ncbi:alpha-E domain-containing protein [Lysinibacillus sp. JNUCC-52]|uniref:alpha-E domain-containing protein n=1 Tax=Lysinibacillus sp. JNUCC-52 TaxID=2792480 RepID=UPI001938E7BB|nr:alpha-E domain-containing protein [Lysinibacillus sp. JNUCC-52]
MLSRVADALYWMARYSERTETNAHILQVQLLNMLEQSGKENEYLDHWEAILDICASKEEFISSYEVIRVNPLIEYLLFSENNSNALHATLRAIRENARITRDSIPIELWELHNAFYLYMQQEITVRERPFPLISLNYFLHNVRKTSLTVTGLIEGSMERDLPFYFMQVGKWLERVEKMIRMILIMLEQQKLMASNLQEADGTFLLDLAKATEPYLRKHHQTYLIHVIQYLLHDEHFPRSVIVCLKKLEEAFMHIEEDHLTARFLALNTPLRALLTAINNIDLSTTSLEEAIFSMEERLCQCIDFGHTFSTIYHLYEPSLQS